MKFFKIFIFFIFLSSGFTFSQTINLDSAELKNTRKNISERILKCLFGNSIYWGVNYYNYYFDKELLKTDNDTLSKITGISNDVLLNYYISWKRNDKFLFSESYPIINKKKLKLIEKKLNPGQTSAVLISGLFFMPNGYVVSTVDVYCRGLCYAIYLYFYKYREQNKLEVIYSKLIYYS